MAQPGKHDDQIAQTEKGPATGTLAGVAGVVADKGRRSSRSCPAWTGGSRGRSAWGPGTRSRPGSSMPASCREAVVCDRAWTWSTPALATKPLVLLRAAAGGEGPIEPRTALSCRWRAPADLLEIVAPERGGARRHARQRIDTPSTAPVGAHRKHRAAAHRRRRGAAAVAATVATGSLRPHLRQATAAACDRQIDGAAGRSPSWCGSVLLARFRSGSLPETVAVFVAMPGAVGVTTMVIVADAPTARFAHRASHRARRARNSGHTFPGWRNRGVGHAGGQGVGDRHPGGGTRPGVGDHQRGGRGCGRPGRGRGALRGDRQVGIGVVGVDDDPCGRGVCWRGWDRPRWRRPWRVACSYRSVGPRRTVTVADAPTATVARTAQVTVARRLGRRSPWVEDAQEKVTPAGRGSVRSPVGGTWACVGHL